MMLQGKTALITGSSRGIGKSIAQQFAEQDCYVGINYVTQDRAAEQTLKSLKNKNQSGMLLKGDISIKEDVSKIVSVLTNKRKSINILVHNAGIYHRHDFKDITQKEWNQIMDVNLNAAYTITKEVLPFMPNGGRIIFISSQLAFKGTSHGADYATSKAGLLGLMRSLSLELAQQNILVNAIAPGTIDTDIIANYTKEQRQSRINEIPLHRIGKPKDIATVSLFLASDLASYITGETINVNGGLYIH
ncbi:MAG TPA: 3-oxoacyl-ACP reductase family protein [Candidatus Thermoplasmatota archaeon]|nr:3-oxoacyl-ACP reductase family protein [Candidatus Thermoplasmatota archaeon]